jgi:hypothetical protein
MENAVCASLKKRKIAPRLSEFKGIVKWKNDPEIAGQ